jgi:ElaB/YqjD/DUF883 family membrane-anchored ribosome-binding protein
MTLRRADGIARVNVCRIVLPHTDIQEMLNAVDNASAMLFKRTYSVSNSVRIIKDNWHARPNFKANYNVSQKCIAILSEALCGQHLLGEDFIDDAVWARIEAGGENETQDIQEQDILDAIQNLYEAADVIDSAWDDNKAAKANIKGKGHKQVYKTRKQMEQATAIGNAAREAMGEEAAEAAYVGKGKVKAVDDDLAGRLQKTTVPDNTMAEDDSEDSEPVLPPDRMRRG